MASKTRCPVAIYFQDIESILQLGTFPSTWNKHSDNNRDIATIIMRIIIAMILVIWTYLTPTSNPSSPVYPHLVTRHPLIPKTSVVRPFMNFNVDKSKETPDCKDNAAFGPKEIIVHMQNQHIWNKRFL